MFRTLSLAAFAALALLACSSEKNEGAAQPSIATTTMPLSMAVNVAPGSEQHRCRFIKVADAFDGYIVSMAHEYTPGSHHLVLFRTDLTEIPPGQEGDIDCFAPGGEVMGRARGVVYASQDEKGETKLPDGVGLALDGGSVLLLQTHYLNAGVSPIDAKVDVRLSIAARSPAIRDEAGVLFFYDPFIAVPPRGRASALMRCAIPKSIKLLGGLSHMHKRGVSFEAFIDPPTGDLSPAPFYKSDDWEHPAGFEGSLDVAAGSKLRFRCDYANAAGEAEVVQGQSADTNEMCIFTGLYYPRMTIAEELCGNGGADMLGAGTKACKESLECVQSCPPGTTPVLSLSGVPDVHPCWQRCFAEGCPTSSKALLPALSCIRGKCGPDCADTSTAACATCVLKNCATEYSACQTHTCN